MIRIGSSLVLAALIVVFAARLGVTVGLGAHPSWAQSVALFAVVPGVVLALIAMRWPRPGFVLAALGAAGGGVAAWAGKAAFAASYAENGLAGQFWHAGWIVACAGAIAIVALVLARLLPRG